MNYTPVYYYPQEVFRYSSISKQEADFKGYMRLLWEQHVAWTRMTILSIVFNLPDVDVVTARLLRNPTDMGNAIKPFYGDQIAAKYSNLMKDHLVIAADLVKAAKAGDQAGAVNAERKWYANADDIAAFLSAINPYLSRSEIRKMLFDHLALTKQEAVFILQKDYKSGVTEFDKVETEALQMSDAIADGIVKQFPHVFR